MHSHHSHSGQFCQHAKDQLEDVVKQAIAKGFKVFCLTEHIPRIREQDLYPEEVESQTTTDGLRRTFEAYYREATRLKAVYADKIELLVGYEAERISTEYLEFIEQLERAYDFDMNVGSVHHVGEHPIDFDEDMWQAAMQASGGTVRAVVNRYFDDQYEMIDRLWPSVIAHFDLIRLKAPKGTIPDDLREWPDTWEKIERNVRAGIACNSLFEINTAAVRKGWATPYPAPDVARAIVQLGGKFCLSDDSHAVAQVGQHYDSAINYLAALGVESVYTLKQTGFFQTSPVAVPLADLKSAGW